MHNQPDGPTSSLAPLSLRPMNLITTPPWPDYSLLDSGHGHKLERFGPVTLIRPEAQATWRPALPRAVWDAAHAMFVAATEGGQWDYRQALPARWEMRYRDLRFWVRAAESRQVGVFPENAVQWDWIAEQVRLADRPLRVINLFGYTGLATLAAAAAGAAVTHVDASRKAVTWARDNQALSGLQERPIRWIVEDALTYLRREARRGVRYDGIVMDPPAFGRGPQGEVWRFDHLFSELVQAVGRVLSDAPQFVVITVYTKGVAIESLQTALAGLAVGLGGRWESGELATVEQSAGRILHNALFVRWHADHGA